MAGVVGTAGFTEAERPQSPAGSLSMTSSGDFAPSGDFRRSITTTPFKESVMARDIHADLSIPASAAAAETRACVASSSRTDAITDLRAYGAADPRPWVGSLATERLPYANK
jgi:hypothetical protein